MLENGNTLVKPRISTLTIKRFRALRQLKIEGLGHVNLITGRNNTGKSSILEALRILASDGSPSVLYDILRYREEDMGDTEESSRSIDVEGMFLVSTLFSDFPKFSPKLDAIEIAANGGSRPLQLTMGVGWLSEERDQDGTRKYVIMQEDRFEAGVAIPALVIESIGNRRIFPLDRLQRYSYRNRPLRPDSTDEPNMPCMFVSPYGGESTVSMGVLWDKIVLSDLEKDIINALRIIAPEISAVTMVGGDGPRRQRTAIVRSGSLSRPVPLRSFGDGLNRLFGIVLSLVNAKEGLLLIDEFENGMHHTVQLDAWRAIFTLSRQLGIQVFATSHSRDCIEAFQKAASESPEDGALVRLTCKGSDIIPTVFTEDELSVATRDWIELR